MRNVADEKREELWAESVRRHAEQQRWELEAKRHEYHTGQAERLRRTPESLVSYHDSQRTTVSYKTTRASPT